MLTFNLILPHNLYQTYTIVYSAFCIFYSSLLQILFLKFYSISKMESGKKNQGVFSFIKQYKICGVGLLFCLQKIFLFQYLGVSSISPFIFLLRVCSSYQMLSLHCELLKTRQSSCIGSLGMLPLLVAVCSVFACAVTQWKNFFYFCWNIIIINS